MLCILNFIKVYIHIYIYVVKYIFLSVDFHLLFPIVPNTLKIWHVSSFLCTNMRSQELILLEEAITWRKKLILYEKFHKMVTPPAHPHFGCPLKKDFKTTFLSVTLYMVQVSPKYFPSLEPEKIFEPVSFAVCVKFKVFLIFRAIC